MLVLTNEDVAQVLDEALAIHALRAAYTAFSEGHAAYAPRIDLYAPPEAGADAYRCGSMAGIVPTAGVAAFRIKSDVVSWRDGVEEKYCTRPGLYSGIILLYSVSNGAPLAIVQDGVLQHVRVGAAVALGVDALASAAAERMTMIGTGGMAWSCLKAITHLRPIGHVSVYSRSHGNRERFAERVVRELGLAATVCESPEQAMAGSPLVISATNSLEPTVACDWLAPGAHITFVSRREAPADLHDRVAAVYRLGDWSLPVGADIPRAEWYRGAFAGFAAGPETFKAGLPRYRSRGEHRERDLAAQFNRLPRFEDGDRTSLIAVGTQGLQFAAVGGAVLARAQAMGLGFELSDSWFLQSVKD
jgi:alanine dehydrogenase